MRLPRWTPVAVAAALALAAGGVAAAAGQERPDSPQGTAGSGVVNVEGHEVDEHAAFGQTTASQAREQGDDEDTEDTDGPETDDEGTEAQDSDETDAEHGQSGQAHGHAGEHGQGHAWAFGHLSPEARHDAIAAMQAANRAAHGAEHGAGHADTRPEQGQQHARGGGR